MKPPTVMRMTRILFALALLLIPAVRGAALNGEIIRKQGHYSLDGKGSDLTITKEATGSWSLKAAWRSGNETSSVTPDECIRSDDWFVYVENSNRLWVFDGVEAATLITNSPKEAGVKWLAMPRLETSPRKFWEALPEAVRTKSQKGKDKAQNASQSGERPRSSEAPKPRAPAAGQ